MAKNNTVLTGFHAVSARLKKDPSTIEAVYADPNRRDARMKQILEQLAKAGVRVMKADLIKDWWL